MKIELPLGLVQVKHDWEPITKDAEVLAKCLKTGFKVTVILNTRNKEKLRNWESVMTWFNCNARQKDGFCSLGANRWKECHVLPWRAK